MKKSNKELSIIYSEKNESPIVVDDIEANKVFKQLFNLINLNHPELGEVKELVVSGEYLSACQLYVSVLAKRFSQFPMINQFSYWLYNTSDADELLEGILTFTHYGNPHRQFTTNIGKPGNINFFKKASLDYDLSVRDISSMQWVTQYAETYAKTKDKKYLKGWQETWTDFILNWEKQYSKIQSISQIWGKRANGQRKIIGIDWLKNQLYRAWRIGTIQSGLVAVVKTAITADQLTEIDEVKLALLLLWVAREEADPALKFLVNAENFVPNQIRCLAGAMFNLGIYLNEFKKAGDWRQKAAPVLTMGYLPDGSDMEQSINYIGDFSIYIEKLENIPVELRDEVLLKKLREKNVYRQRFLKSLIRPDGFEPAIGNNNVWRNFGKKNDIKPFSKGFTSIYFPYGGYVFMRDGWQADSLYLFMKTSRPGRGHRRDQDNTLQLSAYGRNLLISSVGEMYNTRGNWRNYWLSSVGDNTICVDGYGGSGGKAEDPTQLNDVLWYSSKDFDFIENEITGTYSGWNFLKDGSKINNEEKKVITDVSHKRQVHFLRQMGCWIITDIVKSKRPHYFTQTWCLGPEFKESQVITDESTKYIYTKQSKNPNLSLYHFGVPELSYKKYYGEYSEDRILGWVGVFEDRDKYQYTPAVDIHANWHGQGHQVLVTFVFPRKDESNPVQSIENLSSENVIGFKTILTSGEQIYYYTSLNKEKMKVDTIETFAQNLLVCQNNVNNLTGIVLRPSEFILQKKQMTLNNTHGFEFLINKGEIFKKEISVPANFKWQKFSTGYKPSCE